MFMDWSKGKHGRPIRTNDRDFLISFYGSRMFVSTHKSKPGTQVKEERPTTKPNSK